MSRYPLHYPAQHTPAHNPSSGALLKPNPAANRESQSPSDDGSTFHSYTKDELDLDGNKPPFLCILIYSASATRWSTGWPELLLNCSNFEHGWDPKASHERVHDLRPKTQTTGLSREPVDANGWNKQNSKQGMESDGNGKLFICPTITMLIIPFSPINNTIWTRQSI